MPALAEERELVKTGLAIKQAAYDAKPVVGRFRVLMGKHHEGGRTYQTGEIVESKSDLLKLNASERVVRETKGKGLKFERVVERNETYNRTYSNPNPAPQQSAQSVQQQSSIAIAESGPPDVSGPVAGNDKGAKVNRGRV